MKRELTDLLRLFAEDEEHCIDDIGFAAAIGANNRRETLQAQELHHHVFLAPQHYM